MKLLYFAWVRERTGTSAEEIPCPDGVLTVEDLVKWQRERGDGFAEAFADGNLVRVAVNQTHVEMDHSVNDGDEIAFFPPVTGG